MTKAHYLAPQAVLPEDALPVRLGATNGKFTVADAGKFVKLAAESMYDLCAAGDPIEAAVLAVEPATSAGQVVGSIYDRGIMFVLADGLQATPGTGTLAVGDYVVCGTVTAKNTALATGLPKVCKATQQPGITEATVVGDVNDQLKVAMFAWRVESLGAGGSGAVGAQIAIRRVNG